MGGNSMDTNIQAVDYLRVGGQQKVEKNERAIFISVFDRLRTASSSFKNASKLTEWMSPTSHRVLPQLQLLCYAMPPRAWDFHPQSNKGCAHSLSTLLAAVTISSSQLSSRVNCLLIRVLYVHSCDVVYCRKYCILHTRITVVAQATTIVVLKARHQTLRKRPRTCRRNHQCRRRGRRAAETISTWICMFYNINQDVQYSVQYGNLLS